MSIERTIDVQKINFLRDLKAGTGSPNYNPDPKFAVSSIPKSSDFKFPVSSLSTDVEEESIETVDAGLNRLSFRRPSLTWADQLGLVVKTDSDLQDEKAEICDSSEIKDALQELQLGIKVSLEKLPSHPERDVLMTDFNTVEVVNFSKDGPNFSDSSFSIRVYAPVAFRFFRELFGITTDDFQQSVCEAHFCPVNSFSNSGSMFFTTKDDRFILKTVQKKEAKFLRALFPGYFLNLAQHTKTLLPKYYGLFSHVKRVRTIRILIMNNIFPTNLVFHQKFDLKGSTHAGRKHSKSDWDKSRGQTVVYKDLDFVEFWPEGFFLHSQTYNILLKAIDRDCKVLESYSIMDYSLLLGVVLSDDEAYSVNVMDYRESMSATTAKKNKNLIGPFEARTVNGANVYLYMGVIDILQSYNWKKKAECHFKSLFYKKSTISVNRPDFYSHRFQSFLKESIFKCTPRVAPSSKKDDLEAEILQSEFVE